MAKEDDFGQDDESIASNPAYVLPRFNTLHVLAQEQLRFDDRDSAKQSYNQMLALYDSINKSNLPAADKQKAYGKLMYIFTGLSNEQVFESEPSLVHMGKYLFPISLVLIVLVIIFFIRPEFSLTGLAVADVNSAPQWTGADAGFKVRGTTDINLDIYFADPDGDRLSYSVSSAPNLDISVSGSNLRIKPDPMVRGMRVVSITASDRTSSARIIATLDIE